MIELNNFSKILLSINEFSINELSINGFSILISGFSETTSIHKVLYLFLASLLLRKQIINSSPIKILTLSPKATCSGCNLTLW